MTEEEIEKLFQQVLNQRGMLTKAGISKSKAYDWRKGRSPIQFGEKLEVLYRLKYINIHESY